MKSKQPIYFPFYNIDSELVKAALGVKDGRSVRSRLEKASIPIRKRGEMDTVDCDDLMKVIDDGEVFVNYQAKGKLSKKLDELD